VHIYLILDYLCPTLLNVQEVGIKLHNKWTIKTKGKTVAKQKEIIKKRYSVHFSTWK